MTCRGFDATRHPPFAGIAAANLPVYHRRVAARPGGGLRVGETPATRQHYFRHGLNSLSQLVGSLVKIIFFLPSFNWDGLKFDIIHLFSTGSKTKHQSDNHHDNIHTSSQLRTISNVDPLLFRFLVVWVCASGSTKKPQRARETNDSRYGCRILQRLFENCQAEQMEGIVNLLLSQATTPLGILRMCQN